MPEPYVNPDASNASKPDIAANTIYPALARATLFELHANLLELLMKWLSLREAPKNLVVVGPGSEVLPYSEHLESLASLLAGGNLILLEYNKEICDKIPAYLENKGFASRFRIERSKDEDIIDPGNFHNTILVKQWDIRNGYPLPVDSVDAIDMTVSMHHATQYVSDINDLFIHAKKILKTGAILHLGEGDVDMKYSERKIKRFAQDVLGSGVQGVRVSDSRNEDFSPRKWHVGEEDTGALIHINSNGMVSIHHSDIKTVSSHLVKSGYKQLQITDNTAVLPLIDHSMEEDFQGMIVPIRAFYDAIAELCLQRLDSAHHKEFVKALSKERSDAERGIVEYYSLPSSLCDALNNTGFIIDEKRYTANGPFVNILAINQE
jgi:SAM-dependent methyltransferase